MSHLKLNKHTFLALLGAMLFFVAAEPALASNTSGGGLPFDSWLTTLRSSITGPLALTGSIIGIVAAGLTLIFGGDMNGFLRAILFLVLVLSLIVGANNLLSSVTGQGAELANVLITSKGGIA